MNCSLEKHCLVTIFMMLPMTWKFAFVRPVLFRWNLLSKEQEVWTGKLGVKLPNFCVDEIYSTHRERAHGLLCESNFTGVLHKVKPQTRIWHRPPPLVKPRKLHFVIYIKSLVLRHSPDFLNICNVYFEMSFYRSE